MRQSGVLIAVIVGAGFVIASSASYGQNGPPADGQCVVTCSQELGACLESVGAALQACTAGLETPVDIPMDVPEDVQICLDAADLARVGCESEFDTCVTECGVNGPAAFN